MGLFLFVEFRAHGYRPVGGAWPWGNRKTPLPRSRERGVGIKGGACGESPPPASSGCPPGTSGSLPVGVRVFGAPLPDLLAVEAFVAESVGEYMAGVAVKLTHTTV